MSVSGYVGWDESYEPCFVEGEPPYGHLEELQSEVREFLESLSPKFE